MSSNISVYGNIVRDAETNYTASGTAILKFTVADNHGWGENKKTNYWVVTIFGKRAESESLVASLTKGTAVVVFGEVDLQKREHNGKTYFDAVIYPPMNGLTFAGGAKSSETKAARPSKKNEQADDSDLDDDIPF